MEELRTQLETYLHDHGPELASRALVAALVLLGTVIAVRVARSAVRATLAARVEHRRATTLLPVLQSLVRATIWSVGLVTALHQLGLNITTVLAGAGVLGIAVGFGAQTLVRDVISGFFLILDKVVDAGDHIMFGTVSGLVEEVGLRMTKIRSFDGRLWYVPNGELKIVGNFNREWARAVVNIPLPHEQDVEAAIILIDEAVRDWAQENGELVLEPPETQGVLAIASNNVEVRVVVKVKAMEHWAAERALARRLKRVFAEAGLEMPMPRQVVYHRGAPPSA